ncbi:MAG: tRNA (guanosine(46)-N7)-methyltransferase TrmB [Candidatus Scalindua rubra]|uniref:tRNA (guanine-N(7)-)-methyltransferase n=1 Tax=Candidatus Scalindua brodae TaxID=237368 RepID=A0A0B0EIQ0_9BACT|nr:MAG: tRNA (guanine-N(7)-)-methyltransferase [Candidatus Scalindua brodae]MBZ0110203.1 tRNA (guanosine(46)-N7)-methyltransferase TrmB [Candidatus Scalindua rubra]TWU31299.1 tRNA (guanine-N(7)-)-methyltransferase [Candidatus Brocadiaceae bacterium S225]
MGRKKLWRLEELEDFDNLIQFTDQPEEEDFRLRGTWAKDHFKNANPITLELACGKGDYTIALAEKHPDRNFIGIDMKGPRLWSGCVAAQEHGLINVAFLRIEILNLAHYFAEGEIDEIWITFPDPFLKNGSSNKRLTSTRYLEAYKQVTKAGATIHLKTDSTPLFEFSLRSLRDNRCTVGEKIDDVHGDDERHEDLYIKTNYEKKHLADNRIIKYVRFSLAE